MKKNFSFFMAGLILLSSIYPTRVGAEDIEVEETQANELEQIEMKKQDIQESQNVIQNQLSEIKMAEMDIEAAFGEIERLGIERQALAEEIEVLTKEIKDLDESIKKSQAELEDLEARLDEKIQVFKKRLDVMYKNRNAGTISLLLEADSADDFLTRVNSMKTLADYDKDMIKEMNQMKGDLDLLILNLKGTKASRDQAYENLTFKEASLLDAINDQQAYIAMLEANKNLAASEVDRLNSVVDNLNSEIQDLNLQYQERLRKEEEERKRKEEEARRAAEKARAEEAARQAALAAEASKEAASSTPSVDLSYNLGEGANFTPFDGEIVYFNQREEPWGSHPYGNGFYSSIAANGCGPTSMAMVVSSLTDKYVTPSDMANYATAGGHVMPGDSGSYWSLFPAAASTYGLSCLQTTSQNQINEALASGSLVVASMDSSLGGYWALGGHFIVLTGIDENGYISVADPWSRAKSVISHSQMHVYTPLKSAWIISGK